MLNGGSSIVQLAGMPSEGISKRIHNTQSETLISLRIFVFRRYPVISICEKIYIVGTAVETPISFEIYIFTQIRHCAKGLPERLCWCGAARKCLAKDATMFLFYGNPMLSRAFF
jgi:hypothetical protein